MRTLAWTATALVAFAANSWLCRLALRGAYIDPVDFTTIRLASGALMLWPLASWAGRANTKGPADRGNWPSALALVAYALGFSLAYVTLDTGVGALILFGAVQATMIAAALGAGERPGPREWIGLVAATAGLVHLMSPGASAPNPYGAAAMLAAGAAWGVYSLRGRRQSRPIEVTAGNFARAVPLTLAASACVWSLQGFGSARPSGIALAVVSGAVTSGLGYVVWYAAVRGLTATEAAVAQLSVPVIAALGGVALLAERLTPRLAVDSLLVLGGVGLCVIRKRRR